MKEPLFKELRARAELRRAEREADRIAAGILTKEEQRAERQAWLREERERWLNENY